ncbi:hypothetical protein [Agrobacterium sp. CG674]
MSLAARCLALLSAFFVCVKIPTRRGLYLLSLATLAIAASTQVAFVLSNACSNVNVPLTTSEAYAASFDFQGGTEFETGKEFVFTVKTQDSHPDEMVFGSDERNASPVAYWSNDLNERGDYRPVTGAEIDEVVIVPINVTTNYYFGI